MANIGETATLSVLRETGAGLILDGGELGEVLLPKSERLDSQNEQAEVFLYRDSDDRPIATQKQPYVRPGCFGVLKVASINNTGAFLDWGLSKDLLLPYREQNHLPEKAKKVVVYVGVDLKSNRLVASQRISKHLSHQSPPYREGDKVKAIIYGKTEMGYKAIVDNQYSGLLFKNQVFEKLFYGDELETYISQVRPDHKLDLSLYAPGRAKVTNLEERILHELEMRGGFLALHDKSTPEEIHQELGISKKVFKQATGSLFKQRKIIFEENGIRQTDAVS
jgi:predicted RNA-binding protein (virulence factor B family)